VTVTDTERVAALTEEAAAALVEARRSLIVAADVADEVGALLGRSEADILDLAGEARRMEVADEPGPHLRNAQRLADDIERRIRTGRSGLEELGDHLDQGARALHVGRQVLVELEQVHGRRGAAIESQRLRLEGLGQAVQEATKGADEAGRRLAAAQRTIEPLLYSSSHVDDRRGTAATIAGVGTEVRNDVMAVQQRLADLQENLGRSGPTADVAAQQGVDLALAARAATNPTPASDQRRTGGADPARSQEQPARRPGLER
jgi:hypothetical protein